MSNIWFTSDWHFNHNKSFVYEPRGFKNVYDMNKMIIKNFNSVVKYEDTVYCLGDCMLGDNAIGISCLKQLNCGNIKIILGNHCTKVREELYKTMYNVEVLGYANILKYHHYTFYLSHYPTIVSNYDADKPLKARVINLCGHSHTQDKFHDFDKGLIYHCELDAHNNTLVSIDQIILDIKERINNNGKY